MNTEITSGGKLTLGLGSIPSFFLQEKIPTRRNKIKRAVINLAEIRFITPPYVYSAQFKSQSINILKKITTFIYKIPPNLPFSKGGITPLWQRGVRGDFRGLMSIQF
jgi:hypothetical protein